jgi:hypothetical protein
MVYGESPYLYGIHASSAGNGWNSTGADLLGGKGWIVFTEAIGCDPGNLSGRDYTPWANKGLGIITRLNNGYNPHGTIPVSRDYPQFATRCGNYVAHSEGCHIWIVGNEPNHKQERPDDQPITPVQYADCYAQCRATIHSVQPDAQVLLAGPAPWNWSGGDFGIYWDIVIREATQRGGFDGVAVHTYTHGPDPVLVFDDALMSPPGEAYYWQFRVYRDLLEPVPEGIPIYITETDQADPWADVNSGWVKNAYQEVDGWNQAHPEKAVRCLALYRWTNDQWTFKNKAGVQADLMDALERGYRWEEPTDPPGQEDTVKTIDVANAGFEDGWREVDGIGELKVANSWHPWWQEETVRPEFKIATTDIDAHRVRTGHAAQQWFTTHARHHGGIYQTIDLSGTGCKLGERLTFTAWVQSFTRNDDANWLICNGRYWLDIGIDPYGGTDHASLDITWSDAKRGYVWYEELDEVRSEYQECMVTVPMCSNRVTLWVRGQAEWSVKHNNGYVDDCTLTYVSKEPEPPEPPPVGEYVTRAEMIQYHADKTPVHVYAAMAAAFQEMTETLLGEVADSRSS